jgi:hypothetical protein
VPRSCDRKLGSRDYYQPELNLKKLEVNTGLEVLPLLQLRGSSALIVV